MSTDEYVERRSSTQCRRYLVWLQQSVHFRLRNGRPLAPFAFAGVLIFADIRASKSRRALSPRAEPYGIFTPDRPIRNRKLTRAGARECLKESIMLDVVFVVLGLAVLALMGAYAVGLRQL
jgi:hypothetical protein